jgi:hypothetical protein
MGEGGIEGGAVVCPDTPEHTSSHQTSNSNVKEALRGVGDAQWENDGKKANTAREHCQRKPTHNGRDRGGGQHDERQRRTTTEEDNGQ